MKYPAALSVGLAICAFAQSSTHDGVYTDRQAERGQASYKTACASCHRDTLEGSGAATPKLAGPDFLARWNGETLGDLFDRIQTTMPADHPGTLSREDTAAILAFILKVNKLPAGKNELPTAAEALQKIKIEP